MGHDPDSLVLERYYIDAVPTTDLSALTLGERQETERMERLNASLATHALSADAIKRLHGAPLNALVRKIIANDNDYPFGGSQTEQKYYRRRVSKAAYNALLSKEVQKQRESISTLDVTKRIEALEESRLIERVFAKAKQFLRGAGHDDDIDSGIDISVDEDGQFPEIAFEEEPEEDLDDNYDPIAGPANTETDEGAVEENVDDEAVPYNVAVKSFMEIILTNALGTFKDIKNDPVQCPACLEDDIVDQADKVFARKPFTDSV